MNTPLQPENSGIRPFTSNMEYLLAEVDWLLLRIQRIGLQRTSDELSEAQVIRPSGRSHVGQGNCISNQIAGLLQQEQQAREDIDERRKLNGSGGPALGLDTMCQDFRLNDFERTLLLLAFAPCLGPSANMDHISRVSAFRTAGAIYVETINTIMEFPPERCLDGILSLRPDAPLRKHQLVRLPYDPATPCDVLTVSIELTGKALAQMTGIAAFEGFPAEPDFGDRP